MVWVEPRKVTRGALAGGLRHISVGLAPCVIAGKTGLLRLLRDDAGEEAPLGTRAGDSGPVPPRVGGAQGGAGQAPRSIASSLWRSRPDSVTSCSRMGFLPNMRFAC